MSCLNIPIKGAVGWDDLRGGVDVSLPEAGASHHLAGQQGHAEGSHSQSEHTQGLVKF